MVDMGECYCKFKLKLNIMKVVINNCFGGFGLSVEAVKRYAELAGFNVFSYCTDYKSKDFDKTIRWKSGDRDFCIYWVKDDLGDTPDKDALNNANWFNERDLKRDDPNLIKVVEELGDKANGSYAKLKIVEIPDGTNYTIQEYDGNEHIAETHQTWS